MERKLRAIVLGGTDDHTRLLEVLKGHGYHTTLLDYFPNPPAKQAADVHIQESALDRERVVELAAALKADLVISACIDQALPVACYVAERLKLPAPFSYQTALQVTNKLQSKRVMVESGIPTSAFAAVGPSQALDVDGLRYPLMVKPADSHGSFGVRKANSPSELSEFISQAQQISRSHTAIVEEYCQGMEVSVDAFVSDTDTKVLMLGNLRKKIIGDNINLIFQNVIPPNISAKAVGRIQEIVSGLAGAFKLRNTPLLVQTIVSGDEVNVIEFAPRIGGGAKHKTIKRVTGFDILSALVDSFLGIRPKCETSQNGHWYSRSHLYALPGTFGHIENVDRLLADGVIEEFVAYKTSGMEIGANYASKDRIGSFLVRGDSAEGLTHKIRTAVDLLQVYDLDGRPIMRKDIFDGPHL